jgi:hypothetical protein
VDVVRQQAQQQAEAGLLAKKEMKMVAFISIRAMMVVQR